jgi:hypothetical protein
LAERINLAPSFYEDFIQPDADQRPWNVSNREIGAATAPLFEESTVRFFSLLALFTFPAAFICAPALAATPEFTITATNVTMPASSTGTATSQLTLTSLNGYTGTVTIQCGPVNYRPGMKLPYCPWGLPVGYTLDVNQTVKGSIYFSYIPVPIANALPRLDPKPSHAPEGLALASVLLAGLGFRRRCARWFALIALAVVTLGGVAGITACGGSSISGTYPYTLTATDTTDNSLSASTTIKVTIP